MDEPIAPDDVLASPTRARLFALLQELKRPARTEELATQLGLHVNGVRRHLDRLRDAGLAIRTKASGARGRPHHEWAIAPQAAPGGRRPRGYHELAAWLARAIPPVPARLREVEQAGRAVGRELVPDAAGRSAEEFGAILSALGFSPELEVGADGSAHCRLCNCPYRDSVLENSDVVCTMHRGITSGLLDRLAPSARVTRFEPHDPDSAGCLVEMIGTDWPPATPETT